MQLVASAYGVGSVATGWRRNDQKSMVIPVATGEALCKSAKVGRAGRISFLRPPCVE